MEIPAALEALIELLRTTKDPYNNDVRRCSRRLDRVVLHSLQETTCRTHVEALILLVTMDTPAIHENTVLSACQCLQQQHQQHDGDGNSHDHDNMLQPDHVDALMDRIASLYRLDLQDSPIGIALLQLITTTCQDPDESSYLLLNGMETIQLLQLLLPPTIQELSHRWTPRDDSDQHVYNKRSFVLLVLKHLESLIPTTAIKPDHTLDTCQPVVRQRLQEVTLWIQQHCGPYTTTNTTTTTTSNTITTTFLSLLCTMAEDLVEYSLDAMNDTDSTTTAEQVMPHVSLASVMVQLLHDGLGIVVAATTISSMVTTLALYVTSLPMKDHGIAVPLLVHLAQTMMGTLSFTDREQVICIAMLCDVNNFHTWMTPTISTGSVSRSVLLTRTRQVVEMASMVLAQSATVALETTTHDKNDPWQSLLVRQRHDRQLNQHQ